MYLAFSLWALQIAHKLEPKAALAVLNLLSAIGWPLTWRGASKITCSGSLEGRGRGWPQGWRLANLPFLPIKLKILNLLMGPIKIILYSQQGPGHSGCPDCAPPPKGPAPEELVVNLSAALKIFYF